MRLEHYPLEQLKRKILEIAGKYLDLAQYKLFFFGSRTEQAGSERSDIDIGIEGPRPVTEGVLSRIREELEELKLLYKIDVVDFGNVAEDFRGVALRKVEWITTKT